MKFRKDGKLSLNYNDKIVLQEWLKNPNFSYKDIEDRLNNIKFPRVFVSERKKSFRNSGLIKREMVELDTEYFGFSYKAIVLVKLSNIADLDIFRDTMSVLPDVREVRLISGQYDFMLTTLNQDHHQHKEFIKYIQNLDMIQRMSSMEVTDIVVDKTQIPTNF